MSEPFASDAIQVSRVLTEVGHRARLARLLPVSIFALSIGLAALGGAIVYLGRSWSGAGWLIAGAVIVALLAASLLAFARRPGGDVLARRLDHSLGLSEQLSTAASATTTDGPIHRAQLANAERAAAGIDVERAAPLRTTALVASLVALLITAGGATLAYALFAAGPEPTPLPSVTEEAAAQPPAITGEDLDILAELVADDAERRNSDYLEALSNSLKSLAEKARDGASQAELQTELEALLEHAQTGYQGQMPNWMKAAGDEPAATLKNAVAFSQQRQQAAEERAQLAKLNGEGPKVSSADMYTLSDDRLATGAVPQPTGNDPPSDNALADREGNLQSESLAGGDTMARPMEDEAFSSAGSLPVGAAAQSGKGESNIAGGGSQALAPNSQFLETMADPTQSMSIAAAEVSEGSRIRMHVPTSAEVSDEAALGSAGGADWSRQMAQVVTRQAISPEASSVVARYFNRPPPAEAQ